jgi:ABC-type nitrate/sulfonate/bicarbonate transport system substrate-binding protein
MLLQTPVCGLQVRDSVRGKFVSEVATTNYWLYQWLDDNGVRKSEDVFKVLRPRQAIDRLLELQANAPTHSTQPFASGQSVMAGRRIDLSGMLGCGDFECLLPQIAHIRAAERNG